MTVHLREYMCSMEFMIFLLVMGELRVTRRLSAVRGWVMMLTVVTVVVVLILSICMAIAVRRHVGILTMTCPAVRLVKQVQVVLFTLALKVLVGESLLLSPTVLVRQMEAVGMLSLALGATWVWLVVLLGVEEWCLGKCLVTVLTVVLNVLAMLTNRLFKFLILMVLVGVVVSLLESLSPARPTPS